MDGINRYEDIINLEHHVSSSRPQMPRLDRAAQFSPFAALTGYDDAIRETARVTEKRVELEESQLEDLDAAVHRLMESDASQKEVTITFFQPDTKKAGGTYRTVTGVLKKVDEYKKCMVFFDGTIIPFSDILSIDENV